MIIDHERLNQGYNDGYELSVLKHIAPFYLQGWYMGYMDKITGRGHKDAR